MYKYKITTAIMSLIFRGKHYSASDGNLKNVVYSSNCITSSYSKYCNYHIGRIDKHVKMKMVKIDLAKYIKMSQETKGNEESKERLKELMSEVCKLQYNIIKMTRTLFLTVNRYLRTLGIYASCSDCCSNPHSVKVRGENRYFSVLVAKTQDLINQINEIIDKGIEVEFHRRLNIDIGIDIIENYNENQIQYFRLCIKTLENTQKIITERENIVVDVLRKDTMLPFDTINVINEFVGCPSTSRVTG